jgi:hypothetical protein
LSAKATSEYLKVSFPGAQKALNALEEAGIMIETIGRKRDKAYVAKDIMEILEEDMRKQQLQDNETKSKRKNQFK